MRKEDQMIRILWLDTEHNEEILKGFPEDYDVDVILEGGYSHLVGYLPASDPELKKFLNRGKAADVVVLGNNMGAGLERARIIAQEYPELVSKTIVTWFEPPKSTLEYVRLGFRAFCLREDLKRAIAQRLGLSH